MQTPLSIQPVYFIVFLGLVVFFWTEDPEAKPDVNVYHGCPFGAVFCLCNHHLCLHDSINPGSHKESCAHFQEQSNNSCPQRQFSLQLDTK